MILSSGTTGPSPGGTEYGSWVVLDPSRHGPNSNPRICLFQVRASVASGSEDTWDGATISLQSKVAGEADADAFDHADSALTANGMEEVVVKPGWQVGYKIVAAGSAAGTLNIDKIALY